MRLPDWYKRLQDYLAEHRSDSFKYGRFDCCAFAAGAVTEITGEDVFSPFRGRYTDPESAQAALDARGGLMRVLRETFGNPASQGRYGDLALVSQDQIMVLGVVLGEHIACASSQGVILVSRDHARFYWRVG